MSVIASEIKHRKSTNHPSDNTSTVGGAITTTDVSSTIGDVFHGVTANPDEGDATKYQYKKTGLVNINADTPLTGTKVWLANSLDAVASNGVVSAVSTSASDDSNLKIRVTGEDGSGQVQTEDITLNGTSAVTGALTFSKVFWVELLNASSGALVNATGTITISVNGTALGVIPVGKFCALGCVDIGLAATLDDSATTTNAETAPAGISFTRPRTEAGGLSVANGGSLTNGSAQSIWWRLTVEGGLTPAAHLAIVLGWTGDTV